MRELLTRLKFLLRRKPSGDLEEELQFHLDQSIQANLASGMSPEQARRQARIEFGGFANTREETFRQRPSWLLETLLQDTRYALRGFRRNPAFTFTVLATLALGIGATTAVFSVVDRILFRPLPYAHDDRLVSVGIAQSLERQEFTLGGFFFDWQLAQRPFTALTYERGVGECSLTEAHPIGLHCGAVAQNFLATLGVAPVLGRNFLPQEDQPRGPAVAILSYALWSSRFQRDPSVLGRTIDLDGSPTRIVEPVTALRCE